MGSSTTAASRARSRITTAALGAAWFLALAACASEPDSKRRPDPPGGGVDPATITPDNLKMGGDGAQGPPERVESASPSPNPSPIPASPGAGASPPPATGSTAAPAKGGAPAAGSFKMTAEHCKELGRKFEQLTLGQGGGKREAKQIGDDFAAKCTKDKAGEMQEKREYDCILAVKSVLDIQGCK